jgi:hypothetical protein
MGLTASPSQEPVTEELAIGIDGDGAAVGLSFDVCTSCVAGDIMMGSIYQSLKALQNKSREGHSLLK